MSVAAAKRMSRRLGKADTSRHLSVGSAATTVGAGKPAANAPAKANPAPATKSRRPRLVIDSPIAPSARHCKKMPFARHALERPGAAVAKIQTGAGHQILHCAGDQHLVAFG